VSDLRSRILNVDDLPEEEVVVPEWDNITIIVRGMTGQSRAAMMSRSVDPETGEMSMEALYPEVIIATVYDPETGQPVFDANDRGPLNLKSSGVLERIAQIGMRLSGLTRDEQTELGKDSSRASDASTSDSQNT